MLPDRLLLWGCVHREELNFHPVDWAWQKVPERKHVRVFLVERPRHRVDAIVTRIPVTKKTMWLDQGELISPFKCLDKRIKWYFPLFSVNKSIYLSVILTRKHTNWALFITYWVWWHKRLFLADASLFIYLFNFLTDRFFRKTVVTCEILSANWIFGQS